MDLGIYRIKAASNNDPDFENNCQTFLNDIGQSSGFELFLADEETFIHQPIHVIFVASGGSEQQFVKMHNLINGPYYLLTRPSHNSLAAAMEILAFLQERGLRGEILHGDNETLGKKLQQILTVALAKERMKSYNLGTTGESSWLIASKVDPQVLEKNSGMKLLDIPFEELLSEIKQKKYAENQYTQELKRQKYNGQELESALHVYGAMRRLVDRYSLKGITIRCFDILQPVCITGCLGLAILNAEGIYAACEGDGRALVSMAVLGELTGLPVFMANPARLFPEKREIVFAHCTLPMNMPEQYRLTTHFESGLGVSIAGELPEDKCTIFKCKEDFKEYYAQSGRILENLSEDCLCRTQIRIGLPEDLSYFLKQPIANHHMICMGDHKSLLDEFFK